VATSFKDFMIELAPPWLRGVKGEAWARANGDVKDSLLDRMKQAVKARFGLIAPSDALNLLGAERQLPKGPTETVDTYRTRVVGAWTAWPKAGTAHGVLCALRDAGYPGTQIVIAKAKKYELDGNGDLVITDLGAGILPTHWSSFFFYFPAASFPVGWGGVPPVEGSDEALFIISQVKKWKSAHARFDRVVLDMGGPVWGLSTWGSFNWGGVAPVIWEGPF
jgi:hypothetical protein